MTQTMQRPPQGKCYYCQAKTSISCDKCLNWTCAGGTTFFTVWVKGEQITVSYCGACSYGTGYGGEVPPIQEVTP